MTPSHRTSYFWPLVIFGLSFVLRLSLVSKGPYHVDCLYLVMQVEKTFETHQLQYLFGFGYPLTVIFASCAVLLGQWTGMNDPFMCVNLMSAVFGALGVFVFYLIAQDFFDEKAAVLGALIFSLNPIFLGVSTYGTSHTLSVFFLL